MPAAGSTASLETPATRRTCQASPTTPGRHPWTDIGEGLAEVMAQATAVIVEPIL